MDYFDILLAKKLEDDRDPKVEGLSVSANGRYHEDGVVYDPVIVNVPETPLSKLTVTENGTYTAPSGTAYNEVEVDVPLPENAYLLKDIPNTPTAIATFSDGANLPMPKLEVAIEPQQDLHGYDAPWVGGSGKNKLKYPYYASSTTINDVTFTVNDDGTVKVNGTASADASFYLAYTGSDMILPQGEYTLNGCPSGGSNSTYMLNITNVSTQDIGSGANFTSDGTTSLNIRIIVRANTTASNLLFKPMIRLATETDATFAPYSNICPISGWDEVNVSVSGVNLFDKTTIQTGYVNDATGAVNTGAGAKCTDFIRVLPNTSYYIKSEQASGMWGAYYDENKNYVSGVTSYSNSVITTPSNAKYVRLTVFYNNSGNVDTFGINYPSTDTEYHAYNGQTYTLDLDGTRYGGKVDLVSGVMTLTHGYIASYNGETLPSTWISDRDVYAEGTTPTIGAEVVYELATPLTIQLTPTLVKSLQGINNVFADSGDVLNAEYFSREV